MTVRERPTSGILVVRERRIAYASAGAAAVLGREPRDLMGRVLVEFLAPEERERVDDRQARRLRGEPVPAEYEMVLLLPQGGRRTVEAHVSLEGRDELVLQLRDLSDQAERRGRLLGLAELGVAIQRERSEEAIHERVREGLFDLGLAAMLVRLEPVGARVGWARVPSAVRVALEARLGRPIAGALGRTTPFLQAAWEEGAAFADDFLEQAAAFLPADQAEVVRALGVAEALVRGLAVRLEARTGPSGCLVVAGEWIRPGDLPALRLFAAQVAAALDSALAIEALSIRNFDLAALHRLGELAGGAVGLDQFLPRAGEVIRSTARCEGLAVFATDPEGGAARLVHAAGISPALAGALPGFGADGPPDPWPGQRRPRVAQAADQPEPLRGALAGDELATFAWVPLSVRSRAFGAMVVAWREARAEVGCRPDFLAAMGAHLAAAMESDHLLADLRHRVAELTRLNEAAARQQAETERRAHDLEAISSLALRFFAGAPGDVKRILAEACALVRQALGAQLAVVLRLDEADQALTIEASDGMPVPASAARVPLSSSALVSEALATGLPATTENSVTDPRSAMFGRTDVVPLAMLAVPVASRTRRRGVVLVGAALGRRFAPADLALATALGGELAMALESAEHHAEAQRRLAELAAIIDVARVVASSLDLDQVLDSGAEHLRLTLGGDGCTMLLVDQPAGLLRRAAWRGEPLEQEMVPLDASSLARDALASGVLAVGRLADPAGGAPRSVLAVPLLVRDEALGVALVSVPGGARPFGEADRTRAVAIASQLGVAVDNARLYLETRRRAEELSLLQDVGRTLVETLQLDQVLAAGVRNLARMVDAPEAYLVLLDEATQELVVQAVSGQSQALLGLRLRGDTAGSAVAQCMARREPLLLDDATTDPRANQTLRALTGLRSGLALPLLVRDKAIGAAMIVESRRVRRFSAAEVLRATGVANQLAVAVDNARAHARALAALAELQQAQAKLLRQERLAALGELAAVVAHEVRNPLGVIFNSLGTLRRILRPEGDALTLLDIVGEEAERLNRIVGDLLDFARPAPPQLLAERLDRVAEEALTAALALHPGAVEVVRELDRALPAVPLDARQVRQALLNLLVNAVQAMPGGGRLTLRVRLEGAAAVLEVEDTGVGIPEDVRGRIFEPFFTTKATGSGLGLAVVKRVIDGHAGEISVRSRPMVGTVFSLRFPLVPSPAQAPSGRVG